ncbi:MAG: hypothetical protein PHP53_24075 [Prolixibacteraceae bacterium]|nr:hypothetical protein [Prolixibacteraceae bacterium]
MKKKIERINLYIDRDLFTVIKSQADADFLPASAWVKQYLKKNLLKNNQMSNPLNYEK